jgi:hypothetical protein
MKGWQTMDNNNSFVEKAREIFDNLGKKTDEAIRISKLKASKATIKLELRDAYSKLGGAFYDARKYGNNNEAQISQLVLNIDTLIEKTHTLDANINDLINKSICKVCGTVNLKTARYCQHCGALLEVDTYTAYEPQADNYESVYDDSEKTDSDVAPESNEPNDDDTII